MQPTVRYRAIKLNHYISPWGVFVKVPFRSSEVKPELWVELPSAGNLWSYVPQAFINAG